MEQEQIDRWTTAFGETDRTQEYDKRLGEIGGIIEGLSTSASTLTKETKAKMMAVVGLYISLKSDQPDVIGKIILLEKTLSITDRVMREGPVTRSAGEQPVASFSERARTIKGKISEMRSVADSENEDLMAFYTYAAEYVGAIDMGGGKNIAGQLKLMEDALGIKKEVYRAGEA